MRPPEVPVVEVWAGPSDRDEESDRLANRLLNATEVARIGKQDEGELHEIFGRIETVDLDDAGRIYIFDSSFQTIRVFSLDGSFIQAVGHPGEGPGEFVRATAATLNRADGSLYVGDNSRRLQRFSWQPTGDEEHLVYDGVVHLELVPRGLCRPAERFVAYATTFAEVFPGGQEVAGPSPDVLNLVFPSGKTEKSFGRLYESSSTSVNLQNSWSVLACDLESNRIYLTPEFNLGETHAFDLQGNLLWILVYRAFRPMDVVVKTPGPQDSVSQGIPKDGFHQVEASTVMENGQLLVQMALVVSVDGGVVETREIDSYLVSAENGTAVSLGHRIPLIVAANSSYYVAMEHVPNPQLTVFRMDDDGRLR